MYKKILCATDFSETSFGAIEAACALAKAFQSELLLVHVAVPVPALAAAEAPLAFPIPQQSEAGMALAINAVEYDKAVVAGAWKRLRAVAAAKVDAGLHPKLDVLSGAPAWMIDQYAEEQRADLIVVATHGMTGWRHHVIGSVAHAVIQHTKLPVLVVRGPRKNPCESSVSATV